MLSGDHSSRHIRPVNAVAKAGRLGHQHNPVGDPEFRVMTHKPTQPDNARNGEKQQGYRAAENPPSHLDGKEKKFLYQCDTQNLSRWNGVETVSPTRAGHSGNLRQTHTSGLSPRDRPVNSIAVLIMTAIRKSHVLAMAPGFSLSSFIESRRTNAGEIREP